jgi:hypothetical protein
MAHPYNEHRDHHVAKRRVGHIVRGYAHGGAVHHGDELEDVKLIRKTVKPSALKKHGGHVRGRAAGGRLDRKGRKRGDTHVNVMIGSPAGGGAGASPPVVPAGIGAAAPPMPPVRPPMPPMAGGPPGMPPPGMPPIRARGGRIKSGPAWEEGLRNGTQPAKDRPNNDDADVIREHRGVKKVRTFRHGGKVANVSRDEKPALSGSAEGKRNPFPKMHHAGGGGLGRLEKAHKARRGVSAP